MAACTPSVDLTQTITDFAVFSQIPELQVYMTPHTHDDVGWLKTVDEYYRGLRNDIQWANVRSVIDSIVGGLIANPYRRFT